MCVGCNYGFSQSLNAAGSGWYHFTLFPVISQIGILLGYDLYIYIYLIYSIIFLYILLYYIIFLYYLMLS